MKGERGEEKQRRKGGEDGVVIMVDFFYPLTGFFLFL